MTSVLEQSGKLVEGTVGVARAVLPQDNVNSAPGEVPAENKIMISNLPQENYINKQ